MAELTAPATAPGSLGEEPHDGICYGKAKVAHKRGADLPFRRLLRLKLLQNIMMTYIQKDDQFVTFIEPYDADIHVDTALKQVGGSLNALCTQRGMGRILSQKKKNAINQTPIFRRGRQHCQRQAAGRKQSLLLHH